MAAVGSSAAPDRLEQSASLAMLAFAASLQISIAASNILLALTAILWIALLVRGRERIEVPPMFWPLAAYAAVSLVSAVCSIDPHKSLIDSKQLLLFAIVPIAYRLLAGTRTFTAVDVVISVAALSAAIGIVQFGILKWDDLHQRPQGALGMYMTYSGQLMLVACLAVARVLFWSRERLWPMLVLPALVVALATTASRNAWVGACSGIAILMLMRDFVRQRRTVPFAFLPNAGLAIVAAMMTAGMFEYNFGDSEFLMLFLVLITLPYAAGRVTPLAAD